MSNECLAYFAASLCIPISYVGLIYTFDNGTESKFHPSSSIKRITAVVINNIFAVFLTYFLLSWNYESPFLKMGFHLDGFFEALIIPSLLTILVYVGSLVAAYSDRTLHNLLTFDFLRSPHYRLRWLKETLVGPISEEIAFRGCAAVLVDHCAGRTFAVFVCPLLFAVSHFHHMIDDLKSGFELAESFALRSLQMGYTYLFGAYATFLFFTTGHIVSPIASHMICNIFGLPNIFSLDQHAESERRALIAWNVVGFLAWLIALSFFTKFSFYH